MGAEGLTLAGLTPGASAEDTALLALAERLAADVMTAEDQEALDYHSTLRRRPADTRTVPQAQSAPFADVPFAIEHTGIALLEHRLPSE